MLKLRVREIAEAQGITDPVALAGKTKVAYATAYRLWQGKLGNEERGIGIFVLYRVAQALDVKLWDIVVEEEPAPSITTIISPRRKVSAPKDEGGK